MQEFVKKNGDTIQVSKKRGQVTISTLNCRGRTLSNQKIFLDIGDTAQLMNAIQGVLNPEDTHIEIFEVGRDDNFPEHQKKIVNPPTGPKNDLKVTGYLHGRYLFVTTLDWKGNWERVVFSNIPDQMNSQVCAEYAAILYALDSQIQQDEYVASLNVISTGRCSVNQMQGSWKSRDNKSYFPYYRKLEAYWIEDWMDSDLVYEPCDGSVVRNDQEREVAKFDPNSDGTEILDFERRFPFDISGSTFHSGTEDFNSLRKAKDWSALEGDWLHPPPEDDIPF